MDEVGGGNSAKPINDMRQKRTASWVDPYNGKQFCCRVDFKPGISVESKPGHFSF
jgi:hypothetical protein